MTIGNALLALILAGLLGMIGQGVRAVAGLKKMGDDALAKGIPPSSAFSPGWFLVSLAIGFIAGVIAGLSLGVQKIIDDPGNFQLLLGIAAAGYTGTDFVEAFSSRFSSGLPTNTPPAAYDGGVAQPNVRPAPSYPPSYPQ